MTTHSNGAASGHAQQAVIRRRPVPSRRRRDGLIQFARDKTSQNGEDGILEHLFSVILSQESQGPRWCVDVGAWDGVHLSNTNSLLTDKGAENDNTHGWKGVLIEADPEKFKQLQALHEPLGNTCVSAIVSGQGSSPNSLSCLLKEQKRKQQQQETNESTSEADLHVLPNNFDFLCIDIDGMDYWVLSDILEHSDWKPKVICVEFNPTMPSDLIYIPPTPTPNNHTNEESRHGASLAALVELACEQHDYVLIETTLYNAFFIEKSTYQSNVALQLLVPDTSIEALHETTMGTSLYQLYDGTLKLWGCQKLLWHRIPIKESVVQMLSPQERNFPFAPSSEGTQQVDNDTLYQTFEANNTIIDVHSWCSPGNETNNDSIRGQCATALLKQLEEDGFAYVRAPLDVPTCESALKFTKMFLQDANENVRRSCLVKDRAKRGYSPFNTENFASLLGLNNGGKNDLVRKFRLGPLSSANGTKDNSNDGGTSVNNSLLQPNVWPRGEDWNQAVEFQETIQHYYSQIASASNAIVSAICHALIQQHVELEPSLRPLMSRWSGSDNDNTPNNDSSILTLLGYRTGARHRQGKKKQFPLVAAHTDVGMVTVLLFDRGQECATLQRRASPNENKKAPDTEWIDVPLPPLVEGKDPIFVVNVADCLSELSGGHLPSTLHRVVPSGTGEHTNKNPATRNGCALFVGLDPHQKLLFPSRKEENLNGEETKEGYSMTFEEWRKQRIARAQSALSSPPGS